jgi:hypothetical protein
VTTRSEWILSIRLNFPKRVLLDLMSAPFEQGGEEDEPDAGYPEVELWEG